MPSSQVIDVVDVVDNQRFRLFNANILLWCFLLNITDGFDLLAIAFAMPSIAKEWNITNMALIGPVFSAAAFGILIGSLLMGNVADRIGRKPTIIFCCFFVGFSVLATAFVQSLTQLIVLRFVCGIGMGGIIPLSLVVTSEFAPKRLRATMMTIANAGMAAGTALPGLAATWLISAYGWRGLFWLGGLIPITIGLLLIFVLPETVKYLALREDRKKRLWDLVIRMRPDLAIDPQNDRIVFSEERKASPSIRHLFAGRLLYMTPLLWVLCIVIGTVAYFIQTWTPTIITQAGLPLSAAAVAIAAFQAGGTTGGALVGIPVDRFGVNPITIGLLIAIPVIAMMGQPGLSNTYLLIIMAMAGFTMIAVLQGSYAIAGLVYPTFIRGSGLGWSSGTTRVGQMIGGVIGGFLLSLGISTQSLFYLLAALLALGFIASFVLGRLFVKRDEPISPELALQGSASLSP